MDGAHAQPGRGVRLRLLGSLAVVTAMVLGAGAVADAKRPKPRDVTRLAATTELATAEPAPTTSLGAMSSVVEQIGADDLWAAGVTGAGVNVAVVDTGVVPVPALDDSDKVVAVVDLSTEAAIPELRYLDTYGHGTHMAGIIAGRDEATGFRGVAPDAGLVSVKVADNAGTTDISQVIAGVDWVVDHADELDIRVLNLSYSSGSPLGYEIDPLSAAVERAWHAGIVVVVAAGNDHRSAGELASPADNPYVIAVAGAEARKGGWFTVPNWATSGDGTRNPDLAAPGQSIESLRVPGSRIDVEHPEGYVDEWTFKGTGSSQAAAVVSGAAALVLQARPELTPDQVKGLLQAEAGLIAPPTPHFSGAGVVQLDGVLGASTPDLVRDWPRAEGTGSIEEARDGVHVVIDGVVIEGEITVLGARWSGARWTGARWSGAHWSGAHWSGGEWMGARWSGAHWSGAHWSGADWSGAHWSGARWSGAHWSGAHWSGARWSGARWSGARWCGEAWTGARWS